jgi:hypothetical protein
MKITNFKNKNLKIFVITSFVTGVSIFLFSVFGHFLTPAKLIPSSFIGGTAGIILSILLCIKKNIIDRINFLYVVIFTLITFGAVSFVIAFNLNKPLLVVGFFFLIGLTSVISNRYFKKHPAISKYKVFCVVGILLALPALYFVTASIMKFQFGYSFLFNPVDDLLSTTNGQQNFNAITPFLFGGGLGLSFFLNAFSQLELVKNKNGLLPFRVVRMRINLYNLSVVILTGFIGMLIMSYLVIENLG